MSNFSAIDEELECRRNQSFTKLEMKKQIEEKGSDKDEDYFKHVDWEADIFEMNLHRLRVPPAVIFTKETPQNLFLGKLKIFNDSTLYIAYRVMSSYVKKFTIKNRLGWIGPKSYVDVFIYTRTKRKGRYYYFHEFFNEGFSVFGLPLHSKTQIDMSRIIVLWRGLGTSVFPYEATEVHRVFICPMNEECYSNCNIITAGLWNPRMDTLDVENDLRPIKENFFQIVWTDVESYQKFATHQLRSCKILMEKVRKNHEQFISNVYAVLAIIILATLVFIACNSIGI